MIAKDVLRIGIVGAGLIAGVMANAIKNVEGIKLVAVASRKKLSAQNFADEFGIKQVFEHWSELVANDQIDEVYICTPTAFREEIALEAAKNKKHILVEKPFLSLESVMRITKQAQAQGVAFMDGTHFSHHPRSRTIKKDIENTIGQVKAIRSCFFFPSNDKSNIRLNVEKEPTGALGDMGWYCMRAIVEYMNDLSEVKVCKAIVDRDEDTGAIIRGSGVIIFEDGRSSTFDFGYNTGVCLMDLDILGEKGMIRLDDYVLDWSKSFVFSNPDFNVGYTLRKEVMTPEQFEYITVNSALPQAELMVKHFIELTKNPDGKAAKESTDIAVQTQKLLDHVWRGCQ